MQLQHCCKAPYKEIYVFNRLKTEVHLNIKVQFVNTENTLRVHYKGSSVNAISEIRNTMQSFLMFQLVVHRVATRVGRRGATAQGGGV